MCVCLFVFCYCITFLFFVCELRSYFVGCSPTRARNSYAAHTRFRATNHASYFFDRLIFLIGDARGIWRREKIVTRIISEKYVRKSRGRFQTCVSPTHAKPSKKRVQILEISLFIYTFHFHLRCEVQVKDNVKKFQAAQARRILRFCPPL